MGSIDDGGRVFENTFRNIDDVLHKDAGCTSELDYTEQSSWLLFLKYLDALEQDKATEAKTRRTHLRVHPRRAPPVVNLGRTEDIDRSHRSRRREDRR